MDEIQAAFLSVKVPYIDAEATIRNQIANYYIKNIKNRYTILPNAGGNNEHVWHLFVIRTNDRQKFQNYLTENGVQTLIHYPIPPHKQTCYPNFNHYHFPITEKIHNEVISLPLSPVMLLEEFAKVVSIINEYDPAIV